MRLLASMLGSLLIGISSASNAQTSLQQPNNIAPEQSTPESSSPQQSKAQLAEAWGLTINEYERYLELKIVDSSYSADNISPLEVLGKYATGAEQKRYARLHQRLYADNQRRTMNWLIAIQAESDNFQPVDLYDASPEIQAYLGSTGITRPTIAALGSPSSVRPIASQPEAEAQQRIRLFIPYDCDEACIQVFQSLSFKQSLGRYTGIDVIFADAKNTEPDLKHIRNWASTQKIDVEDVRAKNITLNYDSEAYKALRGNATLPIAMTLDGKVVR